jgi:hypothetical protein
VLCCQPPSSLFTPNFIQDFNYQSFVITAATLRKPPVIPQIGLALSVLAGTTKPAPNVRIYCGQVDPRDSSHFTIVYEMWGQRDTLDGYLEDYDYVTLKPRRTPRPPPERRLRN